MKPKFTLRQMLAYLDRCRKDGENDPVDVIWMCLDRDEREANIAREEKKLQKKLAEVSRDIWALHEFREVVQLLNGVENPMKTPPIDLSTCKAGDECVIRSGRIMVYQKRRAVPAGFYELRDKLNGYVHLRRADGKAWVGRDSFLDVVEIRRKEQK